MWVLDMDETPPAAVKAVERMVAAAKSLREFYSLCPPPFPDPFLDALFQAVDALRDEEEPNLKGRKP